MVTVIFKVTSEDIFVGRYNTLLKYVGKLWKNWKGFHLAYLKKIHATRNNILIYLIVCDLVSFCIYTKSHSGFIQTHSSISKFPLYMCKWERENYYFKTAEKNPTCYPFISFISRIVFLFYISSACLLFCFNISHEKIIKIMLRKKIKSWKIQFQNICCRCYFYYSTTVLPLSNFL